MERESYICYKSFIDAAMQLGDEDRLRFYDRLNKYAIYGEDKITSGFAEIMFTLVRPNLDSNNKKYIDGKKGGRPKKTSGYGKQKPNVEVEVEVEVNDNVNNKINPNGFSDEIIKLIELYDKQRKKKLNKLTEQGLDLFIKKLKALGGNCEAGIKQVLEQSIVNGWEGIFEPKKPITNYESVEGFDKGMRTGEYNKMVEILGPDKYREVKAKRKDSSLYLNSPYQGT